MKISKRLWLGDIHYESQIEAEQIRISPRSYRAGEQSGLMAGIAIGIVLGVMFTCLIFGLNLQYSL